MKNKAKKLLCFVAAATMLASTLGFTACGGNYSLDKALLDTPKASVAVTSNGGFAVEKGKYVYFINGAEDYSVNNTYGNVVKGSLMRIEKTALTSDKSADYASAETVIPMLVSPNSATQAGIYIFGDYVYYATPSMDKTVGTGNVNSSKLEFKCAKLDGSNTMKDYFFRLDSASVTYRFVKEENKDGKEIVYCLYEDGTDLKSFNTKTGKTTLLVSGASDYFYNMKDDGTTDANVYYTMNVTENIETKYASTLGYNQIYCVNAAATSKLNAKDASYKVFDENGDLYRTYDFDGKQLEKNNEDFDRNKISTYPYVNLGKLVVDGIGKSSDAILPYNVIGEDGEAEKNQDALQGFTYTIQRYENGGVYYTKAAKDTSSQTPELLFYKPTAGVSAVAANGKAVEIAENTEKLNASALFVNENLYLYISEGTLYRKDLAKNEEIPLATNVNGTLYKTVGDYLYYYGAGSSSSGNQISRINYNGKAEYYDTILNLEKGEDYRPATLDYVDINNSWYLPEILDGGKTLLYSNAQTVGSVSYNYVYATSLECSFEEKNEKYQDAIDYLENDLTTDMKNAAQYLFRTYKRDLEDDVQQFFNDWLKVKETEDFDWKEAFDRDNADETEENGPIWKFKNELKVESDFINMIGQVKEADQDDINKTWKNYLPFEIEGDAKDEGLAWWIITLIVVGSLLVVAAVVLVPLMVIRQRKAKAEAEATVNAYKRVKIDTTDDKSIDVYADEETENTEE